jgi:hypothetical protein
LGDLAIKRERKKTNVVREKKAGPEKTGVVRGRKCDGGRKLLGSDFAPLFGFKLSLNLT